MRGLPRFVLKKTEVRSDEIIVRLPDYPTPGAAPQRRRVFPISVREFT